jgi:dolichol-phosphate mannosyltransferase
MNEIKTAVILPTLNEKDNLCVILPKILEIDAVTYVIIVDDNSTDGSKDYFNEVNSRKLHIISREKRLGIGSAHLDGIEYAAKLDLEYILTMDADGTHRIEDLERMINYPIDSDVLIGSRYLSGGEIVDWSVFRNLLTRLGHLATYVFFGSETDMSSGMRRYNASCIPFTSLKLNCPSDYSFFFTSLLVYKYGKLSVNQIPIKLSNRVHGSSKMDLKKMVAGVFQLLLYGIRVKKITMYD